MTELRRRRGSKRESEAPELDETALVAELHRRAWAWLGGHHAVVEALPEAAASAPPAPPAGEAPPTRRRGKREPTSDGGAALRRKAWSWLKAPAEPPAKKKRAPRREPAAAAADGGAALRRKAWSWLRAPAEAPPKKKRAPRREPAAADGGAALRRKAWLWLLRPIPEAPVEVETPAEIEAPAPVEVPKRRRVKREAALPAGVVALRRSAWAWFAPRATGEAAAGSHTPVRVAAPSGESDGGEVVRSHLKGVLEALIFAAEHALPARELARIARADLKLVKTLLAELVAEYQPRGVRLEEIAGGFVFRTSPVFAPFVREQVAKKPVKMSRAQIETLAIVAYRQPTTRPEIDEVRGVDSGAVLKSLLERELVRIIGKKDEPGRPMLYGTTPAFLEFFGLKALGDLPTLREFTELSDDSKRAYEREMGEEPASGGDTGLMGGEGEMRRQTRAEVPVVDTAALEEDPTLEKEPAAAVPQAEDVEEAAAPVAEAAEESGASEPEAESEPEATADPEDEDDEDDEDEDEDEDEDDEDEDEDD